MTGSGEALRQLLVEAEQAAHVGKDDDAGGALLAGEIGAELRAVAGRQRQVLARRTAGDDPEALGDVGHDRVKGKAHGSGNVPLRRENHHRQRHRPGARRRGRAALGRSDALGVVDRRLRARLPARRPLAPAGRAAHLGFAAGRARARDGDGDRVPRRGGADVRRRGRPRPRVPARALRVRRRRSLGSRWRWTSIRRIGSRPPAAGGCGASSATRCGARCGASPTSWRPIASASLGRMFVFKAAVVGAGAAGVEIAQAIAAAGLPVLLKDAHETLVDAGVAQARELSEKAAAKLVAKGKLTDEAAAAQVEQIIGLITPVTGYERFGDVDFAIEAMPEELELKHRVFAELDAATPGHAILASSTSELSITEIGEITLRPDQVVGFHPVGPRLVELIEGDDTSPETMQAAATFAQAVRKTAVRCAECSGLHRRPRPRVRGRRARRRGGAARRRVRRSLPPVCRAGRRARPAEGVRRGLPHARGGRRGRARHRHRADARRRRGPGAVRRGRPARARRDAGGAGGRRGRVGRALRAAADPAPAGLPGPAGRHRAARASTRTRSPRTATRTRRSSSTCAASSRSSGSTTRPPTRSRPT